MLYTFVKFIQFFVCIQCKLTLQVKSKHIKSFKRKKKLKPSWWTWRKKKEEKGKSLNQKYCSQHYSWAYSLFLFMEKKSTNQWLEKRKEKEKRWIVHIEQTKSTIGFTQHSPNECHNIFTKHLFLIVVNHSFIFYYFILTYKKLIPQ